MESMEKLAEQSLTAKQQETFSRPRAIKKAFLIWVEPSTIQGLPNIFRTNYVMFKLMWTVSFLASAGACCYMATQNVFTYFNYDVVTVVKYIDETSDVFPQVTVCNSNPFVTEEGLKFVTSVLELSNITDVSNSSVLAAAYPSNISQITMNYIMGSNLLALAANDRNISDETRKSMGYSFDQFFVSCMYAMNDCEREDWNEYYDPKYGNCFTFNSRYYSNGSERVLKRVSQTGTMSGLMLQLFVPELDDPNSLSMGISAQLFINNQTMLVNSAVGYKVSVGTNLYMDLKKIQNVRMSQPYSDCVENTKSTSGHESFLFKLMVSLNQKYDQQNCFNLFIQIVKTCRCYNQLLTRLETTTKPCESLEEINCGFVAYQSVISSDYKSEYRSLCPPNCDTTIYDYELSFEKFPALNYAHNLAKQERIASLFNHSPVTIDDLRDSLAGLNIYFSDLRYTEVSEIPNTTLDDLISNVGGTLGLFLGLSFMSFVEIIEIFLETVWILFFKRSHSIKCVNS